MSARTLSTRFCTIPPEILARIAETQGRYFAPVMGIDPLTFAEDTLDPRRAEEMADVLGEFVALSGKKVLEIGAGCGVTHIVWCKKFGIDGWGVEPGGEIFDTSAAAARELLQANGLDPARILNAKGEALPFDDNSFDIVYSSNVLEHVDSPSQVLREAVRVLRPGGTLQIICPNYLSYFDGHYLALHPPIFSNRFFCWWIRWIYGRDPRFAATIRTEVNAVWARHQLREIARTIPLKILTLGEAKFVERMDNLRVGEWASLAVVARLVRLAGRLKLNKVIARLMVALRGWTPLIITVTKSR